MGEERGNISALSRRLRVCTKTIYRWLRSYHIDLMNIRAGSRRRVWRWASCAQPVTGRRPCPTDKKAALVCEGRLFVSSFNLKTRNRKLKTLKHCLDRGLGQFDDAVREDPEADDDGGQADIQQRVGRLRATGPRLGSSLK